jgi:integrase
MARKVLNKRISTNIEGVFYKSVINDDKNEIDRIYGIRYREHGKDKLMTIGKKSEGIRESYCKQLRIEILHKINIGQETPMEENKKKNILLDDVAFKYLDSLSLHSSSSTAKDIKSTYINHIQEFLGNKNILKITSDDLEKIQIEKIKLFAPRTVNQIIELFSTIFNYGIKKQLYNSANPSHGLKYFKVDNQRERYLTTEEIMELYAELEYNFTLNLFVRLALTTGCRLEGLLHIQKKDIDMQNNSITLYDLKNKETYKGFLSNDVKKILAKIMPKYKANNFIVSLDDGITQMTKRQIQCRLKPILDKLFNSELDTKDTKNRLVIHSLRHTFASHLAINETPIFTIQKLMNHKDIKMTMRYAKLAPDSGLIQVQELYQ